MDKQSATPSPTLSPTLSPTSASGELVTRELREGIAIISLNRPELHNAVSDESRDQLHDAFVWAEANVEARCILVRGNGKSFCSGRDTRTLGNRAAGEDHAARISRSQAVRLHHMAISKPVVGAIQGAAIGVGAELALALDFRVAADNLKLALPEVNFGLVVDTGSSVLVTAMAGPSRAKWLLMSGEIIGAQQALTWGLVDWVVPLAELEEKAMSIARTLASKPPHAMAMAKALVDDISEADLRAGLKRELLSQIVLYEGHEIKAVREARLAKARQGQK